MKVTPAAHLNRTGFNFLIIGLADECWLKRSRIESRLRKSEQGDKWNFCLTAGKIGPRIRRDDEQTSTPEPHAGLQGEGGACRRQGRPNTGSTGGAVRRPPQSDHIVEGAA